jgi:hypothetical protein
MLGAQGLWAGRDLSRATPTVTRGLGFSGLIRRTAPFTRLLRHAHSNLDPHEQSVTWWQLHDIHSGGNSFLNKFRVSDSTSWDANLVARFYAPAIKWPGAYSVTLRHSVILSFRHSINGFRSLFLERLHTFNSNLVHEYIIGLCRSSSNLVMVGWFFDRVIPLVINFGFRSLTFVWTYV